MVSLGSWSAKEPSLFTKTVLAEKGLSHHTIPTGAHTYQADVETVHRIIEDEFFEIELFNFPNMLFDKATAYILWFNIARKTATNTTKPHGTSYMKETLSSVLTSPLYLLSPSILFSNLSFSNLIKGDTF